MRGKIKLKIKYLKNILCYKEKYLFCNEMIQVTKVLKGLDKKIIECSWDYKKNQWSFMRERTDKSFPNAYSTAEGKT